MHAQCLTKSVIIRLIYFLLGNRNDSTLITRWCGYINPLSITSTTDALYIRFKTDLFYESKGVNMSYTEYSNSQI